MFAAEEAAHAGFIYLDHLRGKQAVSRTVGRLDGLRVGRLD